MDTFWDEVSGPSLSQGDYLLRCPIPSFSPMPDQEEDVLVKEYDVIIMTQSCDLENAKAEFVALCPLFWLETFERVNPKYKNKSEWENVRKGRVEGLHLLGSPFDPTNNRDARVVDFREIYSLPFTFLSQHAENLGTRWRLKSPYLEHFSQAFARFFMRVGLPSGVPPYK